MSPVPHPIEALHRLAHRWRRHRVERLPVEKALGRHLSGSLELPPDRRAGDPDRASVNGYALGPDQGAGTYLFQVPMEDAFPEAAPMGTEDPGGSAEAILQRVDSGCLVPPGTVRVVPVERTTLEAASGAGSPRVRIPADRIPPPGWGLDMATGVSLRIPAGTRIGPRLQALLLGRGLHEVETVPPMRVGIASIGSELVDVLDGVPAGASHERDINGLWLAASVAALGHTPQPLGIATDEPPDGRELLLRAYRLKLDALILAGGLGSGTNDRTAELVVRTGGQIVFDRVALRPGGHCLMGETMDLKLAVLGGLPSECAAGWDILMRPALLAALGAPPEVWDWSLRPLPLAAFQPQERIAERWRQLQPGGVDGPGPQCPGDWLCLPVRAQVEGGLFIIESPALNCSTGPWLPGLAGWAVLPGHREREALGAEPPRSIPEIAYLAACEPSERSL